ncbi:hypothetical protein [Cetobacterium sp.]|uniref:hypothetical protein n=1 Tax=Cetobacterium sp. TaxID=2071632 RepID=UPI003F3CB82F
MKLIIKEVMGKERLIQEINKDFKKIFKITGEDDLVLYDLDVKNIFYKRKEEKILKLIFASNGDKISPILFDGKVKVATDILEVVTGTIKFLDIYVDLLELKESK